MAVIFKRASLIFAIVHTSTIFAMEDHNWWQNGRDAEPTPPSKEECDNYTDRFIARRVAFLSSALRAKVHAAVAEAKSCNKEFGIDEAANILERFEDEHDTIESQDRRFCFFHPSSTQEDEAEIEESN